MKYILKFCLKNISASRLRTAIMIICLALTSLAFSVCLFISVSAGDIIEKHLRKDIGKADISVFSQYGGIAPEELSFSAETDAVCLNIYGAELQLHSIENYKYIQKKSVRIIGIDTERAAAFGLLPKTCGLAENEAMISTAVALTFGFKAGDTVAVPCADGSETELAVKDTAYCENLLSAMPMSIIVTPETAMKLSGGRYKYNMAYIDAADDKDISRVMKEIKEKYPDADAEQIMGDFDTEEITGSLSRTFYLIFALTLLLTVFIISGFMKNIAVERMPVIGTFRSIGAERSAAAMILYAESVMYGLLGGIAGTALFLLVRDTFIRKFIFAGSSPEDCVTSPFIPVVTLLLSAAIPVICSAGYIRKAAGAPLRDIILGKKDSAYSPSRKTFILGAALFAASFAAGLFQSFALKTAALFCAVTGTVICVPFALSFISGAAAKRTRGAKFPILRLSLIKLGAEKLTVSGTVILTALTMLTMTVLVTGSSVIKLYSADNFNCDTVIRYLSDKSERYRYITEDKSVSAYEFVYFSEEKITVNGEELKPLIFGGGEYEMFRGIEGLTGEPAKDEIIFDSLLMKRLGIKTGDTVSVIFRSGTVRPEKYELRVAGECSSVYFNESRKSVVISRELYKSLYYDYPAMLLLNTGDSGGIFLADPYAELTAAEELKQQTENDNRLIIRIMGILAASGVVLTVIIMSGNLSLCIEYRRREFAVLHSCGMSKAMIAGSVICETALSVLVSAAVSAVFCPYIISIIRDAFSLSDINIPVSPDFAAISAFLLSLFASVMLTAFLRTGKIRKMNTAEQLKYE